MCELCDPALSFVFIPFDAEGEALLVLTRRVVDVDDLPGHEVIWMAIVADRATRDAILAELRRHEGEWKRLGAVFDADGPDAMWDAAVELVCPDGMPLPMGYA